MSHVDAERGRGLQRAITILTAAAASLLLLFLVVPLAGIVGGWGVAGIRALGTDAELRASLWLTLVSATLATLLGAAGGVPLAYLLSRRRFRGRGLVAALLDLPLVVPHPVAGIALLLVLGRDTPMGQAMLKAGLEITGSTTGIVCAMMFVSAPLLVSAAREAFDRVDPRLEAVARTLGDTPWRAVRRVTLPLAARGLVAAGVVMWARAISEFGAIVVLTYNPKVASVLSYERFTAFGLKSALPVAAVLVLLALVPITVLRTVHAPDSLPERRG
ncbi:MAG: ABC transporter permease [Gemmatimonadaceae bacterium]